jgi:DNA processing protein
VADPEQISEGCGRGEPLPEVSVQDLLEAMAVRGLGPMTVRRLLERFGSWPGVRRAGREELAELGLKRETIRALRGRDWEYDPKEELKKAADLGIRILTFSEPEFPRSLRDQDGLPLLLYVKGGFLERDALAIGVVGSRRASLYGRMHAEQLAFQLAQAQFAVISGLAQGVDAAAHEGALKGGGRTIAVLGCGLDRIYPPENRDLADRIAGSGALVSELPLGSPPTAANFPPRNRIIAALSLGILVVEAARNSGALITARLAGEMGKEVFAVPGDIGRPQTRGPHRLIRDGAKLVETVEDIIEEFGPLTQPLNVCEGEPPIPDPRALMLNEVERAVYSLLDSTPKDIDAITRESRLSAANVGSTLMVLELKRLAVQMPGKLYVRAGTLQRQ